MPRTLLALPAVVVMALFARARDDDPILAKLDKAKTTYTLELVKYQTEVNASFDKREEAARKAGDKKAVDAIKVERKAFEERGDFPAAAPKATKQRFTTARAAMEKAYAATVKEYTMAKKDEAAAAVEQELAAFKKSFDAISARVRWTHEKGSYTKLPNGEWEEKAGDGKTYKWKETARTKEYVQLSGVLFDMQYTIRLTDKSAEYEYGKGAGFKTEHTGKWAN